MLRSHEQLKWPKPANLRTYLPNNTQTFGKQYDYMANFLVHVYGAISFVHMDLKVPPINFTQFSVLLLIF